MAGVIFDSSGQWNLTGVKLWLKVGLYGDISFKIKRCQTVKESKQEKKYMYYCSFFRSKNMLSFLPDSKVFSKEVKCALCKIMEKNDSC